MKKILVTGASGFVGRSIVEHLKDRYTVTALYNSHPIELNNIRCLKVNLNEPMDLVALESDYEVVIHCAGLIGGLDPQYYEAQYKTNVESTFNILEWSRKNSIKHFVYFSTGAVYGNGLPNLNEESPLAYDSIYGLCKFEAEKLVEFYQRHMTCTILRLFFAYGPGQKKGLVHYLHKRILQGSAVQLNNIAGSPLINPIYKDDLVVYLDKIIESSLSGVFNLGGTENVSIKDICEHMANIENKQVAFEYGDLAEFNVNGDTTKLIEKTGYTPKIRIKEGLEKFCHSVRDPLSRE